MRLEGKTAIVTGASSGIGLGIAQRFAAEGANVVMADLDRAEPEAAAATVAGTTRGQVIGIAMDVTDENAVDSAVAKAIQEFGGIDILCSNAGNQIIGGIHELAFSDWKKVTGGAPRRSFFNHASLFAAYVPVRPGRLYSLHRFCTFQDSPLCSRRRT